jgi:hypothetical protein
MWIEAADNGSRLAYGKVQRAVSGETNNFDDWDELLDRLKAMVANDKRSRQEVEDKDPNDIDEG